MAYAIGASIKTACTNHTSLREAESLPLLIHTHFTIAAANLQWQPLHHESHTALPVPCTIQMPMTHPAYCTSNQCHSLSHSYCCLPTPRTRLIAVVVASTLGLALFGFTGAALGGARVMVGAVRVLIGGWLAMAATYGIGYAFGVSGIA